MKPKPLSWTDRNRVYYRDGDKTINNYHYWEEDVLCAVEGLKQEDMFTLGDFHKAINKWFPVAKKEGGKG